MCGIIGLLIKPESKRSQLGEWVTPMMDCMGDRGPDSAGLAVFSPVGEVPLRRFSLFCGRPGFDWTELGKAFERDTACEADLSAVENHGRLVSPIAPESLEDWLSPGVSLRASALDGPVHRGLQGHGPSRRDRRALRIRRPCGQPLRRSYPHGYRIGGLARPRPSLHRRRRFLPGAQRVPLQPWSLRRRLEKRGVDFETDNDTEAACRFLEWRMREGDPWKTP